MVSARKMIYPQLSQRGENIPKKTRYFDPKTCSQCIVVVAPYPSSLGGVYQPVETQRETPLPMDPYHFVSAEPKHLEIFTHRSFHGSARGICTTVVLWQDCTGSEKQIMFCKMHRMSIHISLTHNSYSSFFY